MWEQDGPLRTSAHRRLARWDGPPTAQAAPPPPAAPRGPPGRLGIGCSPGATVPRTLVTLSADDDGSVPLAGRGHGRTPATCGCSGPLGIRQRRIHPTIGRSSKARSRHRLRRAAVRASPARQCRGPDNGAAERASRRRSTAAPARRERAPPRRRRSRPPPTRRPLRRSRCARADRCGRSRRSPPPSRPAARS